MPTTDSLITGANIALGKFKTGSFKLRYNQRVGAHSFVKALREAGYGVKKWNNLTNKHVGAVVDVWKQDNLSISTIKVYLSSVRTICSIFNNDRIHKDNKEFKIENRVYITNVDKSLPQSVYEKVVSELMASGEDHNLRIAAQLQLERELGLRGEEARKFSADSLLDKNRVFISHGTKGGRERFIHGPSQKAINAINFVKTLVGSKNLIPEDMKDVQWENKYYKILYKHGISKKETGASGHGLRHAYAQEKYEKLTGFKPPCKFESKEAFRINAEKIKGAEWRKLDKNARLIIKAEMGHGPGRDDVVSQYLGSAK